MATAMIANDEVQDDIDFIALPSMDLRSFAGDELRLVAQFSGHFPEADFCDIIVPKLDRTCFNESAGSRKQTYNSKGTGNKHSERGFGPPVTPASVIAVASSSHGLRCKGEIHDHTTHALKSGRSRSAKAVARLISKRKVTVKSVARRVASKQEGGNNVVLGGKTERETHEEELSLEIFDSRDDSLWTNSEDRKPRRVVNLKRARDGKLSRVTKHGARDGTVSINSRIQGPAKSILKTSTVLVPKEKLRKSIDTVNENELEDEKQRKGAKRSSASRDVEDDGLVGSKRRRGSHHDRVGDLLLENRHLGVGHRLERPRRRAQDGDMMNRLAEMKGKWSSSDKTKKIVDAVGFPLGWTVRVGLRRKRGRTLFEYRDWRSPEGTLWPSFKDASAFLLSLVRNDPSSELVLRRPGRGSSFDEEISAVKKIGTHGTVCTYGKNLKRNGSVVSHIHSQALHSQRLGEALDDTDNGEKYEVNGLGFCSLPATGIHLDQPLSVGPIVDKVTNLARPSTGVEVTSPTDELRFEEYQKKVLDTADIHHRSQSACEMSSRTAIQGLIENDHCSAPLKRTYEPSQETGFRNLEQKSNLEAGTRGMEGNVKPGLSNIRNAVYRKGLINNKPRHRCSFCGMIFSSLLKLRWHIRSAKHSRNFKCDVCGRQFLSKGLLLGHRVKMRHPRLSKVTSDTSELHAKGLKSVTSSQGSEMFKIVLGLLSGTNGDSGYKVDHTSFGEKSTSKSLGDLEESKDMLKTFPKEVRQHTEKSSDPSDVFECQTCHKVFYHQSQYWGHLSSHSKQRKKALKRGTFSRIVSERLSSRVADSGSEFGNVARENRGYEAGDQYVAKSVFWRLLDDPLPSFVGPNYEVGPVQDEAVVGPPAELAKEEGWWSEVYSSTFPQAERAQRASRTSSNRATQQ